MLQIQKLKPATVIPLAAIALLLAMQIWNLAPIMDINTTLSGILNAL